ncbi:MAG TPA: flippase activity-associated protein Agl23 [Patescibacteria group bacterium]|nr:flippase activity-associated protein Agl23 [Patescibacteria group bacterium]
MSDLSETTDKSTDEFLSRPLLSAINLDVEKTIYLVIILLALATRLWGIGDRVVSHDESLHTQYSYLYYNGDGYNHTPLMHGPSLFHITALSYWLLGDNDTSARIPVALVGVLLVFMPYFLRGWIGKTGALVASFLLLISPYITYYSRYIRHDILIITSALLVFISIVHYLRKRQDKYIWWFALGMALMFTTMETSFIYVAIFGSFLVLALAAKIFTASWFLDQWRRLLLPLGLVLLALVIFSIGFMGQRAIEKSANAQSEATAVVTDEGFAADPDQELVTEADQDLPSADDTLYRWLQIGGIIVLTGGMFLIAFRLRPYIDEIPEFDLVVLFTTLTLPTATAFLIVMAGKNPLAYTINNCELVGQETMSSIKLFFNQAFNETCRDAFLSSSVLVSAGFLILTLLVSLLVGIWWNRRRWLIAAVIYHGIFLLLFSSLFSNPAGWTSGMVGSLGYWLEQQAVQRANQPSYFYFIVLPLYEFLPLLFMLLAGFYWAAKSRLNKIYAYLFGSVLLAAFTYYLINQLTNQDAVLREEMTRMPAMVAALIVITLAVVLFILLLIRWIQTERIGDGDEDDIDGVWDRMNSAVNELFDFVPYLIWWFVVSWVIYTYAGEKMAWLSSHFVVPMVLMAGWYINEKLTSANLGELRTRRFALLTALDLLFLFALGVVLGPLLLGDISIRGQELDNLTNLGRLIGSLIILGTVVYFFRRVGRIFESGTRRRAWIFAIFLFLALLTIRFTYMSSFTNADNVTEFLVYAHGAPATKNEVLPQLEELSLRLHGDKSIQVAFDNDSSWPFTWYLRDYPNRIYFGEEPGRNVTEAPVVIAGSLNWNKVEPILGDDYEQKNYTFLWWPMEEYRNISWKAILGDPDAEAGTRRGLGNPDVRKALWDIFFYRDYEKYSQVYGGTYTAGQWPLRHDLRMYIRKDVLTTIWDHGVDILAAEPPVDLYAEGELLLSPSLSIGTTGSEVGQLLRPRNMAIGEDGMIFVTDSGNHRIQVFDQDGFFQYSWGEFGIEPGQFNEPWGIAVDDDFVYVADTWNHRIQKFSHDGELIDVFGQSGSPTQDQVGGGLFFGPRDITFNSDGHLVVTDTGNHRLQIFDTDGNFIETVGSQGNLPGQFYEPVGVATMATGSLLVVDTWNGRIQRIGGNLLPETEWAVDAWYGESIENKPYIAVDQNDRVYVSDPEGYRILIFDTTGQYLGRFGQFSLDLDGFGLPNGVAVSPDGSIFVADAGNNRVLKFEIDLNQIPLPPSEP